MSMMKDWRQWLPEIRAADLLIALGLLTRIPVPAHDESGSEPIARSCWAWPLVGVIVGFIAGLAGAALSWLGVSSPLAAIAALGVLILLTGALHEDGLADTIDGLGGGATAEKRLEIMKDSRIGVFGAIGLLLVQLGRWAAMSEASGFQLILVLVAAASASRVAVVLAMAWLEPARESGLSVSVGRPTPRTAGLATVLAAIICIVVVGPVAGVLAIVFSVLGALPICLLAKSLLGGQTGDVLGASQQFAELAVLVTLVSIIA